MLDTTLQDQKESPSSEDRESFSWPCSPVPSPGLTATTGAEADTAASAGVLSLA